jgi:hypothetical protein
VGGREGGKGYYVPRLEGARGLGVFQLEVDVASCFAGERRREDERRLDPGFGRVGRVGTHRDAVIVDMSYDGNSVMWMSVVVVVGCSIYVEEKRD